MVVHCNDSVNGARRVAWLRTPLCSAGHYDVSVRAVRCAGHYDVSVRVVL